MTRWALAIVLVAGVARAQATSRGDTLIAQFKLEPLFTIAGELAALELVEPVKPEQYAKIVAIRQRDPAFQRIGALDETDLAAVALSLCSRAPSPGCATFTTQALRCLADRCTIDFPKKHVDDIETPPECRRMRAKRTPPFGLGFDYGTGWLGSKYPTDGRAWSMGIEGRMRFGRRFGMVARIDRISARDAGEDADDNGEDDVYTGSITRISGLAGPSIAFDLGKWEGDLKFLRLDLLGGYMSTRSQANESGVVVGADISYQLWIFNFGARFLQGFADTRDATTLLVHMGIRTGAMPIEGDEDDCKPERRTSSRLAVGFDVPIGGFGLEKLGLQVGGLAVEPIWHVSHKLDLLARLDMLIFPGDDRDRVIHQAALGGIRIDHAGKGGSVTTGFFTTYAAGYSHEAGLTPTRTGSGPVGDFSIGWGAQDEEFAAYLRLHTRFGISGDNSDYRAFFLSGGLEIRFDRRRWRDRG